jgi:hypothetical protein
MLRRELLEVGAGIVIELRQDHLGGDDEISPA